MTRSLFFSLITAGISVGALAACEGQGYSSAPLIASGGGTEPESGTTHPMLVVVDANRTLNAPAGDGAGVFVEYTEGGHWTISWTCDTTVSHLGCPFSLTVSGAAMSNMLASGLASTDSFTPSAQSWTAQSNTTSNSPTVTFDTAPGATIQVLQVLSGNADGSYFGFVQNGVPNGGYTGPLTDPLDFVPNTP